LPSGKVTFIGLGSLAANSFLCFSISSFQRETRESTKAGFGFNFFFSF
jgi:hypothetical protein